MHGPHIAALDHPTGQDMAPAKIPLGTLTNVHTIWSLLRQLRLRGRHDIGLSSIHYVECVEVQPSMLLHWIQGHSWYEPICMGYIQ